MPWDAVPSLKDRIQEKEDTLTADLVDYLVQLTSPPEPHNRKTERPKVTDWTILDKPPQGLMVTLTCHQHTWWVAQWYTTDTTDRAHTFTPETRTGTPLALRDHFGHLTHNTDHPLAHWLTLKSAMHWIIDAPTTLLAMWLKLTRNSGSLHTQTRDVTGRTLDILAHGQGTNSQTSHHQPARTSKQIFRCAPTL